ncbi:signal peptidase I [Chloroflexota bacterium]
MSKVNATSILGRLFKWLIICLLLTPTTILLILGVTSLFGYGYMTSYGTSMEPSLSDGDMILIKHVEITDVNVGNIIVLSSLEMGHISHRVIRVTPSYQEYYIIETKGDANFNAELWNIYPDDTVSIVLTTDEWTGNYSWNQGSVTVPTYDVTAEDEGVVLE